MFKTAYRSVPTKMLFTFHSKAMYEICNHPSRRYFQYVHINGFSMEAKCSSCS